MLTWADIKEIFFTIGSIAGVIALAKPVFEDKMKRDQIRIQHIIDLLPEQELLNLEYCVWNARAVPSSTFNNLYTLAHELQTKQDCVRFNGPNSKYLKIAVKDITEAYSSLRELVQVPEWEPITHSDGDTVWTFNKEAFINSEGFPSGYAGHLEDAAKRALALTLAFQRFQIVSELHLLEIPFAKQLLARRIKAHGVQSGI